MAESNIAKQINRIENNVNAALQAIEAYGVEVTSANNSDDLATLIASIRNLYIPKSAVPDGYLLCAVKVNNDTLEMQVLNY